WKRFLTPGLVFRTPAEMPRQEPLRRRVEREPVLRAREAVALVGKLHVVDRLARVAQRLDDLQALLALDARVIRTLRDEQRRGNAVNVEERRARPEELGLALRVADALVEHGLHRLP